MHLITHTFIHLYSFPATQPYLPIINDWSCALSPLAVTEGLCLPADSSLQASTLESVVGCLSCFGRGTYTHGERLGSLLDDKALDDMREDLGLDDGLRRFVLSILRRAARHGGRLALIS